MSIKTISTLSLVAVPLLLSGCGYRPVDRAMSGGLIGAGAGAAVGAIVGAPLAASALAGGAIGAIGGAVTSPRAINFGRTPW